MAMATRPTCHQVATRHVRSSSSVVERGGPILAAAPLCCCASQVPELGMKDQVVKVSPEQLVIGLANSWSNPLPVGRTPAGSTGRRRGANGSSLASGS